MINHIDIEKPTIDIIPHLPKGMLRQLMHYPNAKDAQNYNIFEDLSQAPCAMCSLEVL
jgi:hypothetical protein